MDSAIARMVCENFLAQSLPVDMHIDFGGNDTFVAEHLLNGTQVGAVLQQVCGKGMAQSVRAHRFANTRHFCQLLNDVEHHHT